MAAATIGDLAAVRGLQIHGLVAATTSLETAYLELTREAVEYTGTVEHHPHVAPTSTDPARRVA